MKRRGFTLVELLVVIGIIAMLIALLLPSLQRAQAAAKRTVCLSRLAQFYQGTRLWQHDNKGKTFPGSGWAGAIRPYVRTDPVYICPSDPNPFSFGPDRYVIDILQATYDIALSEGPMVRKVVLSPTSYQLQCDDAPDPSQGDHDYNDIIMQVDQLPNNKIMIRFVSIDAGYHFDLVDAATRTVVMRDMGRLTPIGTSIIVDGGKCSYAFNVETDKVYARHEKILALDYYKITANAAGDDKAQWDKPLFARHYGVNVLWSDGGATFMPIRPINPFTTGATGLYWQK